MTTENTVQKLAHGLAQLTGVEPIWSSPNSRGFVHRDVPMKRAWFLFCCDRRMWKVYRITMDGRGMNKPSNSRFARQRRYFLEYTCECCGFTMRPEVP